METDKNRDWALDNEPPTELDNAVNFLNSRKHLQKNGEIDRYAVGRIMLEWASQNASTIESKSIKYKAADMKSSIAHSFNLAQRLKLFLIFGVVW